MRSRTDPGGWQANSVAVRAGVWSTIHSASGRTISVDETRYTNRPASVCMTTSSPATSRSRWRNSALWLVRWPATTTLPSSPGMAVPGQCPGPRFSVARRIPSNIGADRPSAGISMVPTSHVSSDEPSSGGGATGVGSVGATVVGGGGGVVGAGVSSSSSSWLVVVVVVGRVVGGAAATRRRGAAVGAGVASVAVRSSSPHAVRASARTPAPSTWASRRMADSLAKPSTGAPSPITT